ncbi:MAG: hypothetical protein ACI853_002149, partial [Paracoccaceae bacterium]
AMRTASRLNSLLCIAAISGLLDGEYCSQKTGTKPVQVQAANARRFLRDLERACSLRIRTILTPFRDIAAQYPVGQRTTEKSLLTVCLVCVNGREARVRQALHGTGHRTPADPARITTNQRPSSR